MKEIQYNNKTYKLPFPVFLSDNPTETETIKNRFTGEPCQLPQFAAAVYDTIIGSEAIEDHKTMRKGIDWFIKNFTKEYGVLLD